jgi:hypothetical protein
MRCYAGGELGAPGLCACSCCQGHLMLLLGGLQGSLQWRVPGDLWGRAVLWSDPCKTASL